MSNEVAVVFTAKSIERILCQGGTSHGVWTATTPATVFSRSAPETPPLTGWRGRFTDEWKRFCEFLNDADLGTPEINQCEITYVNHIELGKGWSSYGDLNKVVAFWTGDSSGNFLPAPESVNIGARYVLPEKRGRLHIEAQPAIRPHDAKEILQVNLTARGKPESSDLQKILEWFDLGHEWIVRGFTDFTAKEMHNIWERKL